MEILRGRVAGFLDVDLEVHSRYIPSMVSAILDLDDDAATGYRIVARAALGSSFEDTEAGFKCFRRERILPVLDRWHDDYRRRRGLRDG